MNPQKIFSADCVTDKELRYSPCEFITDPAATIDVSTDPEVLRRGKAFADEITARHVADFERPEDKMCHVSTFAVIDGMMYMTYYANTKEPSEDPKNQTARLVYAPVNDPASMTYLDLQTTGDKVGDETIDMVYDTILMQKNADTIYILWTARITTGNYYRFYCPFTLSTKTLGEIGVNRFQVGEITNDFSATGIRSALAANDLPCKNMFSDIGIMQKLSSRMENGERMYYTGTYSGDFTAIIKSRDFVTWEYVSQPDFPNASKWENAVYVYDNKCYYFVRQQDTTQYGFLTAYHLDTGVWEKPVLVADCQSRSDFIEYGGALYLFHAPVDRDHIGMLKIDTNDLTKSCTVFEAKMDTSCFYPFIQYFEDGELAMSYTVNRQHIRLARFTLKNYL